ncbi:N-acetylgalactosamine-N,N'-diacetylbacillosaminyl-diphospho-undecaprenol 4-alpha-N-acetylgalactosaminyltransferase [Pseudomonas sp. THAF187a]|uniref:glycosyltransferase n=1 Tax=unclassified Pseudomonas TaxID=196821 RepID=UPI001267F8E2|nr:MULTISPECIES: glycosyltransferase [unclassified Pseudomonas]QFT20523.1 N-acetylgalactosamine-N,N'-diacetylbacillosaminyl-diphospho-undecaprenol 4-alpha-N-acetylgalactosaminyltransferase [Pseudomonas sp. THAF187a]QFT40713.1 N-acetylgalactosamine-N,N'-diacetylbacillosaminyl-diphospho-undecaprenol 4-alpha-N-acetylgalactosaminyltransferase [Pseudomonas sp. THAF42]
MTASEQAPGPAQRWVLQFCHGYDGPFLDCARQYAVLFKGTPYKVCTVYLTGAPSAEVERGSASDEVIFLDYSSAQVRGLKLGAIRDFRRIAASRDFALCIAHRFKPIYVALLGSALPVIGVHHAFGDYKRRSRQLFANCLRKRLSLLGVSNAVRDDMRACLPSWPAERIETLYNRIDIAAVQAEQVCREQAREHLGLPADAWVVGNVGRLHPDKDQATLIRGFAQALPQLPAGSLLAIMGSGRLEAQLKALAAELGVSDAVRFLGQVANGRRYFKAFDVFALTSDHEPFGMVLLEAMAAGVPVVGTDCGGGSEVLREVGELFPLGAASELAEVLGRQAQISDLQALRERMHVHLQQRFSDAVVRERFWSLPSLRAMLY